MFSDAVPRWCDADSGGRDDESELEQKEEAAGEMAESAAFMLDLALVLFIQ